MKLNSPACISQTKHPKFHIAENINASISMAFVCFSNERRKIKVVKQSRTALKTVSKDFHHKMVNSKWQMCRNLNFVSECGDHKLKRRKKKRRRHWDYDPIFENLAGPKELKLYPEAGHESILRRYESEWVEHVSAFIE